MRAAAGLCALAFLLSCSARASQSAPHGGPETLRGGLYQLREGVLVALAGAEEIRPVRRLPWTVQERAAAAAAIGERIYLGVNGRGFAELDLGAGTPPGIRYFYDAPLFGHRTLTTLIPAGTDLLAHLYFNATLNVVGPEELLLRGVSLLRFQPQSGECRLLTPPFQRVRPDWEAVGFVPSSPRRMAFEWKWSGPEETRFAYTVLSFETEGKPQEMQSDVMSYRNSFGFRDAERDAAEPLRRLLREARRTLDSPGASTAYQVELRREGSPLPERYEYHPPGYARAADIRLYSLSAVERGGRYALLLPDGLLLRAGARAGETTAALPGLRLPTLPSGHRYGVLLLCAESLLATWEQPLFTEVGSAGIFLRRLADFP
jgi:hypothetical protein